MNAKGITSISHNKQGKGVFKMSTVDYKETDIPSLPGMYEAIDKRIKEIEIEKEEAAKKKVVDIKKLLEEDKLKEKSQGVSRNDLPDDLKDTDISFENF